MLAWRSDMFWFRWLKRRQKGTAILFFNFAGIYLKTKSLIEISGCVKVFLLL